MTAERPRITVLGLDGMSPEMLGTLIERGLLPSAGRFLQTATDAPLRSTIPASTIPGWATIFTGVLPGRHGLLWWKRSDPWLPWKTENVPGFTSFHDSPRPPLWRVVEGTGLRTAFVDIPATFPVPSTAEFFVSGFLGPWPHQRAVWPEALRQRAGGWRASDADVGDEGSAKPEELAKKIDWIAEAAEQRLPLFRELGEEDLDLRVFILVGPDRLSHMSWPAILPESSDPTDPVEKSVAQYWRIVNAYFDELISARERGEQVIVCSDHGSTAAPDYRLSLQPWLIEKGYIAPVESLIGRSQRTMRVLDRTRLGLRKTFRPLIHKLKIEDQARALRDRVRTRVWKARHADKAEGSGTAIFGVAMGDREAAFFIDPAHPEADELRKKLSADVSGASIDGHSLFESVHSAQDLLGPLEHPHMPDLIAITEPNVGVSTGKEHDDVFTAEPKPHRGIHQRDGIVLLAIDEAVSLREKPGVEDIMPTILAMLGFEIPTWIDGRPLVDAGAATRSLNLDRGASEERGGISAEDEEAIEDHLRGLGYVE